MSGLIAKCKCSSLAWHHWRASQLHTAAQASSLLMPLSQRQGCYLAKRAKSRASVIPLAGRSWQHSLLVLKSHQLVAGTTFFDVTDTVGLCAHETTIFSACIGRGIMVQVTPRRIQLCNLGGLQRSSTATEAVRMSGAPHAAPLSLCSLLSALCHWQACSGLQPEQRRGLHLQSGTATGMAPRSC